MVYIKEDVYLSPRSVVDNYKQYPQDVTTQHVVIHVYM